MRGLVKVEIVKMFGDSNVWMKMNQDGCSSGHHRVGVGGKLGADDSV